jgi:hypothetical protein
LELSINIFLVILVGVEDNAFGGKGIEYILKQANRSGPGHNIPDEKAVVKCRDSRVAPVNAEKAAEQPVEEVKTVFAAGGENVESVPLQQINQFTETVLADMPSRLFAVFRRYFPVYGFAEVGRYADSQSAIVFEDTGQLAYRLLVVGNVLQHFGADYFVEIGILERKL